MPAELINNRKTVTVYTDGACRGNPGPGGWAAVIVAPSGDEKVLAGGEKTTTNNRMELSAALYALRSAPEGYAIKIVSDSKYLVDGIGKGWAAGWKEKGWKKSDGHPALNSDLWEGILNLLSEREVSFEWVEGHAGHAYNERCDMIATSFADVWKQTL